MCNGYINEDFLIQKYFVTSVFCVYQAKLLYHACVKTKSSKRPVEGNLRTRNLSTGWKTEKWQAV